MVLTAIAIATGVAAGLVAPGRGAGDDPPALRWLPVLLAGASAQLLAELGATPGSWELPAVLASYVAILAFAARNVALTGMPLVAVGVALNLAVTAPNGGMPVRADAVVRAGLADRTDLPALDLGAKRHLESEDDVLGPLGDVIPLRPLREVVSAGDVVLAAGLAAVTSRLLRPRSPRSSRPAATPGRGPSEAVHAHHRPVED